ncbi:thioredoxin family protein [Ramlibacter sp.]|uniref:thioredoxin family protein n=1 Tax=Ramlibacter sp. TaxID=1917967 RepID=UPI002C4FE939|nr:thioredoxin family protein [Ramlibacter sp.]HWI81064.1 thioredoxin family protein [Ramlibacter sp.]
MKKLLLLICLVASFAAAGAALAGPPLPERFDPRRDAAADVAAALALAGAQHKRVIVDVGGEWCSWCHLLDAFVASHPPVRDLLERHYVWVKVNWSPENRNEQLLARWPRVKGYPHLFVLDADGQLLHSQSTGELEAGRGYDEAKFLALLRRFSNGRS